MHAAGLTSTWCQLSWCLNLVPKLSGTKMISCKLTEYQRVYAIKDLFYLGPNLVPYLGALIILGTKLKRIEVESNLLKINKLRNNLYSFILVPKIKFSWCLNN